MTTWFETWTILAIRTLGSLFQILPFLYCVKLKAPHAAGVVCPGAYFCHKMDVGVRAPN